MNPNSLAGRTVVAAVDEPALVPALADAATAAGLLLGVACADPATVVTLNERDVPHVIGFAMAVDDQPAWERLLAHVEQRLGPIDGLLLAVDGDHDPAALVAGVAAVTRDMAARGSGVVVTTGEPLRGFEVEPPVRRVQMRPAGTPPARAAALLAALAGPQRVVGR